MTTITGKILEHTCLEGLKDQGGTLWHAPDLIPGKPGPELKEFRPAALPDCSLPASTGVTPEVPSEGITEAHALFKRSRSDE